MSSKPKSGSGDHDYLHAALVQKRSSEAEHEVYIRTSMGWEGKRSVLVVRLEAVLAHAGWESKPVCAYEVQWPNAYTVGWAPTLFNAYVRLDMLLEESLTGAERALAFKQV